MSRSDDPSSRPVSRPSLKPVSSRGEPKRPAPRKRPEEKPEAAEAKPSDEKARSVVQAYDSDFGVAMLIRGTEEP
jgi:hypothetical protein